ncbi:hypothetical protein [Legionella sp. km772]|uniref:hypothetical protein n=1 Tax=Legionella sp. km772 TaxID=2498111 RepID=UPI000F8DF28B|nr:hypothetical protein [Legionella sp. km772]RUR13132.1 hypothetical protein ELY15_03260 [Legionella sp. km772]
MFTSSLIQKAYELTAYSNTRDKLRYKEEVQKLLLFNKSNKGNDLLIPLNFYLGLLDNTQSALFPYMNETQKNQTLRDLQVTYLLLMSELKYELEHQKKENSKKYQEDLKKCQELIDALMYSQFCTEQQIKPSPEHAYFSDGKPVAYTGLAVGQAFAEEMVAMTSGSTTKEIRDNMGWINEKRLYWVWASVFLKTTLSLLPEDFFNVDQANAVVSSPDLYTGTMSWGLYYFRFALNLGLLLKHTIAGPWMSAEEKSEGWTERFKTQWAQRKFSLLNDSIWATGNLLCFFWLYGKGAAGTWGDILTIALLVFDISLAVWDYEEQRTQYNQQINDYEEALNHLKKQATDLKLSNEKIQKELNELKLALAEAQEESQMQSLQMRISTLQIKKAEQEDSVKELDIQVSALERAKAKCEREWNYQKMTLATSIAYAVGLMLAFVLLTGPFFPFAAATIAAMTIAGAVLCFAFSVINNAIKGGIEIHKTKMTVKELRADQEERIRAFKELAALPHAEENAKKLMFLEIKKLKIESEYQEKLITLQTMKLMRSILIESMIPPLVFLSLVFLPLGAGLGILAAALALAIGTNVLINKLFKAEKEEMKDLDEKEYQEFCADPDNWDKKANNALSFFKNKDKEAVASEQNSEELMPLLSQSGQTSS